MKQWGLWNKYLPNVTPYYAVKSNPDPTILRWIQERGGGFDCASSREMFAVQGALKVWQPDKVIFANPCKTPNDILTGRHLKVPLVTADSCEELLKMDEMNYKPSILLRLAVDDPSASCPFGQKFGVAVEKAGEIAFAAHSLQIPVVGLCFHVGSGSKDPLAYKKAIETSKDLWADLKRGRLVGDLEVLDIGGGWSPKAADFAAAGACARDALSYGERAKRVIAEPGRFFCAPLHHLYVRVIGKKPMADGNGWRYTIDESVYGQFSCVPFDHATPRLARLAMDDRPRKKTRALVFGRTCDSLDILGKSVEMEELEVGDWLFFPEMGAYSVATASEFNGFPKPVQYETGTEPEEVDLRWIESMQYPLANMLDVKKACEL